MISRRKFIQNTSAGLFLTAIPNTTNAINSIKKFELTAKKSKYSFEKNQNKTDLWLFNNNCPGPLITANKNDVIEIIFNNQLDEPSAVHWHGIRNINSMDGVPVLSQPLVEPGESFVYRFPVKDAGTFWYHAHNKAWEQVTRGLYGPLIVSDNDQLDEPAGDHQVALSNVSFSIADAGAVVSAKAQIIVKAADGVSRIEDVSIDATSNAIPAGVTVGNKTTITLNDVNYDMWEVQGASSLSDLQTAVQALKISQVLPNINTSPSSFMTGSTNQPARCLSQPSRAPKAEKSVYAFQPAWRRSVQPSV